MCVTSNPGSLLTVFIPHCIRDKKEIRNIKTAVACYMAEYIKRRNKADYIIFLP